MKRKSLLPTIRLMTILQPSVLFQLERRNFKGTTQEASTGNRHRKAIIECLAKGILRSRNSLPWLFAALMQIRWLCSMVVLTFGMALIGSTPLAAQGNCQTVLDAMNKVFATPSHIYRTMSPVSKDGSKPRTGDTTYSETIYVGESAYTKGVGSWRRSRATLEQVKKLEEGNIKSSKYTCRYLRDEQVNGEPAAVYSTHSERADLAIKSDGQIWISKSRGLPLRQEIEITESESGDKPDVNHHSMRYEYTNVRPPV